MQPAGGLPRSSRLLNRPGARLSALCPARHAARPLCPVQAALRPARRLTSLASFARLLATPVQRAGSTGSRWFSASRCLHMARVYSKAYRSDEPAMTSLARVYAGERGGKRGGLRWGARRR